MHFSDLGRGAPAGTAVAVQPAIRRHRGLVIPRPTLSPVRARARSQGFSMIELMVVLSFIGFMAMTVLPKMSTMMAENRQYRAAVEVMLAARKARVEAMFSGYASALFFTQTGQGAVVIPVTGLTSRCNRGDNIAYVPAPNTLPQPFPGWQPLPGALPIEMVNYGYVSSIRARLTFNDGNVNTGFLCWEPRGDCWYSATPWNWPAGAVNPQTVMYVERFDPGDNMVGVARQVVFPTSCTARLR